MIKIKLMKAVMLGLCISTLSTGIAYGKVAEGRTSASAGQEQTDISSELMKLQKRIDQTVFNDKAEEIEAKGFDIYYTGVSDSFVEIGIVPFTKENAEYLYKLFGKENVKVVQAEENILYTTTDTAEEQVVEEDIQPEKRSEENKTKENRTEEKKAEENKTEKNEELVDEIPADAPVTHTQEEQDLIEERVYKGEEAQVQIEGADEEVLEVDPELIYQTTIADDGQDDVEVQLEAVAEDSAVVTSVQEEAKSLSAPILVLIVAGAAVLVGAVILMVNKKKTV
ncbi:hypothetical protein H0486_06225 [Lachnospiraceae bacterium MD1]|jgi:hypothetical protein|uniref:Uncharacterized protein n=1 Tax=Variimorphobacter saccharofermentans TaxID=2755051 RepID=A0A839K173_9FIRM|nr:hypothetical protein [Variimorphobacter saccharofermentans]MBB2182471.1 hypothetical protein [Variimorphobacter saccharofermentans]